VTCNALPVVPINPNGTKLAFVTVPPSGEGPVVSFQYYPSRSIRVGKCPSPGSDSESHWHWQLSGCCQWASSWTEFCVFKLRPVMTTSADERGPLAG
jgi:hypothetical protein